MFKVISQDTLLEQRRKQSVEEKVPFVVAGEVDYADKKIVNGEMELLDFNKPLGEMINFGSVSELKELLRKVVLDVELGKEQVQLLYKPIYDEISDPNLPEVLDAKWALSGSCVFLEHMEGDEVKFGSIAAEQGPTARIRTYSTGFEYTKKMIDFNETFKVEMLNKSMGEAYNALLNHLHLYPIINFNYKAANKTAFQGSDGDPVWLGMYKTLAQAVKDSRAAKRPGTVLLANSADAMDIEMALKGGHQINGTVYPAIPGINSVIYYDGWNVTVGKKSYEYKGVDPGKAYLIRPKRGFKELIKKDYTVETGNKDVSRLIEEQIVAYCYRGVFAAVEENVQEITLR
jgi:hypothetical protein